MTETTTTTPETEAAAPVTLTAGELVRTLGDASLIVADDEIEAEISAAAADLKAKLPQFRAAIGGYNVIADHKLTLCQMILTKQGHPHWNMGGDTFKAVWSRVWGVAFEGTPETKRPTKDEQETIEAGVRQQVRRRRDAAIVAFIVRTVKGAEDMDRASEPFKRLVRAEYESANLLAPKEWRKADDTSGSGTGAGPERDDQADAYNAAVQGVSGLYNAETKSGVVPLLHVAAVLRGLCDFGERIAAAGEIPDREKVSDALLAMGSLVSLVTQRTEAPETFGESEADKLRETIKAARKLADAARK